MKKFLFSAAAICALGAFAAPQAQAQSLNYGVMQEMFGEPVTTSANGSPMRASDAPLDMTIISAEDIARYPARAIPDILRHYAGVSVRQNTSTEYSVGIRGYNSAMNERLLVLVNGRQVFEDYFGLVNWSAIPVELNEIRQIEIVRGPNTALFGFNATSGVVNIVTVNPLYDDIDLVEGDAGINSYTRGSGVYTWQNEDKFGLRISGASTKIDEDDNNVNSAITSLRDEVYVRRFNMDAALQLNDKTQMRFEASSGVVDENQKDVFDAVYGRDTDNKSVRANLNSDTDWGIVDFTMYRNAFESEYKGAAGTFNFENDVTVLQLSDTFKIGTSHTVRLASEFRTNTADMTIVGFGTASEETLNIGSLSGLWYWNISDKLSSSIALRYDHVETDFDPGTLGYQASPFNPEQYQNSYDEFGYNLGLVYKPTDIDTLRLTFAKGVDLPSTFELSTVIPGAASLYGDPTIEVSSIFDYQLGYERQLSSINGKFKLGAFYQYIEEMQSTRAISTTLSYYDNVGDSEVYGFEAGLEGLTDGGIRWGVNYSYSEIEDDLISTTGTNFERQHSDHMVKLNLGYSPTEEWAFDVFAAYESDFKQAVDITASTSETRSIDPDVIVDAKIAYSPSKFDGLTLSLNGQAVLGENEQSAAGEEVDSQIFLRAKYEF
ncbi:MAG: TonB-dependent receptor [Alphaproteobacteria bacterium]|nr:TonB-dependent receptor [Alphaproteobacteria bacterium]